MKITAHRSAWVAVAGTILTLSACGSGGAGGDTTCGDYKEMSKSDQTQVIKDFFAEKGKDGASNFEIGATRLSAVAFCKTAGSDSSLIREIDG